MHEIEMERRMVRVETWQQGHDKLCAERFQALRGDIRWALGGVIAVLIALIGWMGAQMYNNMNVQRAPVHVEAPR